MPVCLIGLGSNRGNRRETLEAAVALLAESPAVKILARGAWRKTTPVGGPPGQNPFLNGALTLETSLPPLELLDFLRHVEDRLGRRREERWGPRTLDLDLLLYGDRVLNTPALTLPHPRMAYRRFVLEPAAEVAGSMIHPTTRWTVARLLEHLRTSSPYVAVTGPIAVGKTHLAERLAAAISGRLILERPDWKQLDAFYADPPAHAWETESAFLDQRAGLLEQTSQKTPPPTLWMIGDFWYDQSAAFARAWLPVGRHEAFLERYERLRCGVTKPRLIVLLDLPSDALLDRIRRRGRPCEQRLTAVQLERIRQTLREQAAQPDIGPVLRLDNSDHEAAFVETLAAVRGME